MTLSRLKVVKIRKTIMLNQFILAFLEINMKGFCLDLKVITIGLLCVSIGRGLPDGLRTGSEEAKSNEPLSK